MPKENEFQTVYEDDEPDSLLYACEKLGVAVWKLATGTGVIKERLADAYIELAILQEADFPEELRSQYNQIRYDLTCGKMQYENRVENGQPKLQVDSASFNHRLCGGYTAVNFGFLFLRRINP